MFRWIFKSKENTNYEQQIVEAFKANSKPMSKRQLIDVTGIDKAIVDKVIASLRDRGWCETNGLVWCLFQIPNDSPCC